jgi:uracil-DNA glycosylase family 4
VSDRSREIERIARFVGQQKELGIPELFLDELSRAEVLTASAKALATSRSDRAESVTMSPARSRGGEGRPAGGATAVPDLSGADYDTLKEAAEACQLCRLSNTRSNVVFSDGNPNARLMVVGEAPGANEDKTGVPFVGQAGKLLDLLLAAVDLSRKESVYICNVLKCRPPGNRDPMTDEIELCAPYLKRQIALVAPEVILAVGTFAAQLLTATNRPLGKLRGSVYSYEGVPLVVTYHPAALLRNSGWTRSTWSDLQLLREVMDRD